jgi:branched-chain amino acid transport system permease protein
METTIFAQLINGISIGSIYALLAIGFNLLLLVSGVMQYAYPHVVVLSMYMSWMVFESTGRSMLLGIPAAIGAGLGFSLALEPLFRILSKRGAVIASFIMALGIAVIFTDLMGRVLNYGVPIAFTQSLPSAVPIAQTGIATITLGQMSTILGSVVSVIVFLYILYRTKLGGAFRATAQNAWAARLVGIPSTLTSIRANLIAGLLGGISAVFLAMSLGTAAAPLGDLLALKVVACALLAGLGNLRGGLIAGLILGLVESFAQGYLPGDWTNAIAFAMIFVVVMIKPEGLFGVRA